jgi:hypothetical protein
MQMAGRPGLFDPDQRYAALSAAGDPLERLGAVVDFELFRSELAAVRARSDRAKGGRPPYDAVLTFKILVVQTLYALSDDQTEYQIRDRLSFMRFVGLALHDAVPDAKTIWLYREQLTKAGALERLFARCDAARDAGYLAMAGQIVDATVIEARRPRLTAAAKAMVKAGEVPATGRRRSGRRWTPTAAGPSSAGAGRARARQRRAPPPRLRCRCSGTRTTSASIAWPPERGWGPVPQPGGQAASFGPTP